MPNKIYKNKKGQVGETVTWVIATVIIIVILVVSIFIASAYIGNNKEADLNRQADVLASKSLLAYLLTKDSGGKSVYEQIKTEKNLNNFNGNLALNIFKNFYENPDKEYQQVWFGYSQYSEGLAGGTWNGKRNDYFGGKPKTSGSGFAGMSAEKDSLSNMVYLEENSSAEIFFVWSIK